MFTALDNVEELRVQRFWLVIEQTWRSTNFVRNKSQRLEQAANMYTHKTGFSFIEFRYFLLGYVIADWLWL